MFLSLYFIMSSIADGAVIVPKVEALSFAKIERYKEKMTLLKVSYRHLFQLQFFLRPAFDLCIPREKALEVDQTSAPV